MQARVGTFVVALLVLGFFGLLVALNALGGESGAAPAADGVAGTPADPAPPTPSALNAATGATEAIHPGEGERVELAAGDAVAPARQIALTGRLVRGGSPAADVPIRFAPGLVFAARVEPGEIREPDRQEQRTGPDGRFRFVVPAERPGRLSLGGEEVVFAGLKGDGLAVPASATDRDVGDLELAPAAVVAGQVRDAAGRALEGVEVVLHGEGHALMPGIGGRRVHTGADGRFAFGGLRADEYRVTTASPRHLPGAMTVAVAEGARRDDLVLTLESGGSIWGRVVDDRGDPVAGASVGAYRHRELDGGATVRELAHGESVQTDPQGRFELGGIEQDVVTVRAWHAGHQAVSEAGVRKGSGNLELVVPRSGAVEGRLVDADGAPIAGSTISARPSSGDRAMAPFLRTPVKSAADGTFRLADMAPGDVIVEAEGDEHVLASATAAVQPGQTTPNVVIVAARGAAVAALVVDDRGEPVADAAVEVTSSAAEDAPGPGIRRRRIETRRAVEHGDHDWVFGEGESEVLGSGKTGTDGRVVIGGLRAGQAVVRARHSEHAAARPVQVAVPKSGTVEAELALRPGGAVELRAVDADGAPAADASVVVQGPLAEGSEPEQRSAKTDADGIARLAALPAGSYSAALRLEPRPMRIGGAAILLAGGENEVLESSRVPFVVRAGETAQATLVQPILTAVSGTLRDAAGAVAAGTVELRTAGGAAPPIPGSGQYSATTDAEGRFRITEVPPGSYTVVYGRKGQHVPARESLELHGEREVERQLTLEGGIVTVTVLDDSGSPLRGATVRVQTEGAPAESSRGVVFAMTALGAGGAGEHTMEMGGGPPTVRTGDDGKAAIPDVPPGKYAVFIGHERHVEHRVADVEVNARQTKDLGAVTLARGGMIGGKVEADGGAPMVASVEALRVGDTTPRNTLAMQGAFRFDSLPPGSYRVRARALSPEPNNPWGPAEEVEVEAGGTAQVTVRL